MSVLESKQNYSGIAASSTGARPDLTPNTIARSQRPPTVDIALPDIHNPMCINAQAYTRTVWLPVTIKNGGEMEIRWRDSWDLSVFGN